MRPSRTFHSAAPLAIALAAWAALPSLEWCPVSWAALRAMCTADAACDPLATCGAQACDAVATAGDCASPCDASAQPLCDPTPDASLPLGDRAWCIHPPVEGVAEREIELRVPRVEIPRFLDATPDAPEPPAASRHEWPDPEHAALACSDAHAPPPARAPPRDEPAFS